MRDNPAKYGYFIPGCTPGASDICNNEQKKDANNPDCYQTEGNQRYGPGSGYYVDCKACESPDSPEWLETGNCARFQSPECVANRTKLVG